MTIWISFVIYLLVSNGAIYIITDNNLLTLQQLQVVMALQCAVSGLLFLDVLL